MKSFKYRWINSHTSSKNSIRKSRKSAKEKQLSFGRLEPRQLLAADVVISEFLASNDDGIVDGNNEESDWIELFNAGDQAQDLAGWHLTDNAGDLGRWTFPIGAQSVLQPGEYLVVFASGEGVADPAGNLHTNFSLSASGEYLALSDPSQNIVSEFGANGLDFPEQFTDVSYGLGNNGPAFFQTPTPGAANGAEFDGVVGDTAFSVDRGFFTSAFNVEVTTSTPGATIYYTTDGSVPSPTNGTAYTAPINISTTTNLRAGAFLAGHIPTNIDTQTYIFGEDVLEQPADGGLTVASNRNIDFAVDPDIALDPTYTDRFLQGLQDIPTVSLTSEVEDIFGNSGLYNNSQVDGLEVPTSVEYINVDGTTGFQIDAGLRIAGGASRIPARSSKHSFSLRFRQQYGEGRLNFDLFEDSLVNSFNSLQLRAVYNNSVVHANQDQRDRATQIRDQFIRDSLIAFGQDDAGRGQYTNLFINGLFWGVYNLHERTEAAHFAEHNGGDPDDFDAVNGGTAIDGTQASFNALRNAAANGTWQQVTERLDVENYIDWVLINEYGGNDDLSIGNNWRAAGGGPANAKWRFYSWDAERTLEDPNAVLPGTNEDGIILLSDLREFPEFVEAFEDRIQLHYFNGGALTEEAVAERWQARVDELNIATVGESARWGDIRQANNPIERDVQWVAENNRLLTEYFPVRGENVLARYEALGLFSGVEAPAFAINGSAQHGGLISAGSNLSISASAGTVYFTTDGSDPRGANGQPTGTQFTSPQALSGVTEVQARVQLANGDWSPLLQATFVSATSDLVISEINYNPHGLSSSEAAADPTLDSDEFEFIELLNTSTVETVSLSGVALADGVDFEFGDLSLAPGERIVVVENLDAFQLRYGTGINVAGQWSGGLSNSGEELVLLDSLGNELFSVNYSDGDLFAFEADGGGATLVFDSPATTPVEERGKYYSWRGSVEFGGTPGAAEAAPRGVVINEILSNSNGSQSDAIELFNATASPIDISGYFLSDSGTTRLKYQIPAGTVLGAGAYVVFDESDFNSSGTINDFALSGSSGDEVYLTISDGAGGILELVDQVEFGATFDGQSIGRVPNGTGRFALLESNSLGAVNGVHASDTLVISEVNYHPSDPSAAALEIDPTITDNGLEFIEILNPTAQTIDLAGWRLRGEADFDFPAGTTLGPGENLVVVSFDPSLPTNASRLLAFQTHYGTVGSGATLVGPSTGSLSNDSGVVRLRQPDAPSVLDPTFIAHVTVDEVVYDDIRNNRNPGVVGQPVTTTLVSTSDPARYIVPGSSVGVVRPIAGTDFSDASVFNALGGNFSPNSVDDLDPNDDITVSGFTFGGGGGFRDFDINSEIGLPSDLAVKFDGDNRSIPAVGASTDGLNRHTFSITIPANTTLNLSDVTFDWRQATGTASNSRWLAFNTSLDSGIVWSDTGVLRPGFVSQTLDLSDARYQGLSGVTIDFNFYAGGTNTGDIDIDNIVVNGASLIGPGEILDFNLPSFDDSLWSSGNKAFGYERNTGYEALIGTDVLSDLFGSGQQHLYTRSSFTINSAADLAQISQLQLDANYDDGFIAYLNGVEVARDGGPTGTVGSGLTATTGSHEANGFETFTLDATALNALVVGTNVLAIQGINVSSTSSDFLLDFSLTGTGVAVGTSGGDNDGGGFSLNRTGPSDFGNDPTSWVSEIPTPGSTNFSPEAVDDFFAAQPGATLSGANVLANDSDPEGQSLVVNTTPVVGPTNGTLSLSSNGAFVYTPDPGFSGLDSFEYAVSDANGNTSTATANLDVVSAPSIASVQVGDGTSQRSTVQQLVVTFSGIVDIESDAFDLIQRSDANGAATGLAVSNSFVTTTVNGNTVATISFLSSVRNSFGALNDGNYQLTVDATKVTRAGSTVGLAQDYVFGDSASDGFYSYFGDVSGTRTVTPLDLLRFRQTYRRSAGQTSFDTRLDFAGNGDVTPIDLLQFRRRYRSTISFA